MIEELSSLDYYSSGFKLDKLSYTLKDCIKEKNTNNKEEVLTAEMASKNTSSFFD